MRNSIVIASLFLFPPVVDAFGCREEQKWELFREMLLINEAKGFPLDEDLKMIAEALLRTSIKARLHIDAFERCNMPDLWIGREAPCIFGAISAIWVIARHDNSLCGSYLRQARLLIGGVGKSSCMDFAHSFGWPISFAHIIENIDCSEKFRLPQEFPVLPEPMGSRGTGTDSSTSFGSETALVWELGVHASLSAEPLNTWHQYIRKLRYRHLIREQYPETLPEKCDTLYRGMHCDDTVDAITELFRYSFPTSDISRDVLPNFEPIKVLFLYIAEPLAMEAKVDIFLCTVPYLCLLRIPGVPTIGYFGHPMVFLTPKSDWQLLWESFDAMLADEDSLFTFAVSDPFLQMQYEYQYGRIPPYISTLSVYTKATYFPTRANDVLVVDRPYECILMCTLEHFLNPDKEEVEPREWQMEIEDEGQSGDQGVQMLELLAKQPRRASGPKYPFQFMTRNSQEDRSFKAFSTFLAIALWPYDMDLITFYEFYAMRVPIFMPSRLEKYIFFQGHMDYHGRYHPETPTICCFRVFKHRLA